MIHPTVRAIETDPTTIAPAFGQPWLVGPGATNEWLGHDDQIAGWTGNGWLFLAPLALIRVFVESIDNFVVYRGSWQLTDAIETPAGGAVIDVEARIVIDSILAALEAQGFLQSSA